MVYNYLNGSEYSKIVNSVAIKRTSCAYSNPLKLISFKIGKVMEIDRRTGIDRRQVNFNSDSNQVERRKRPDRRADGFDVRDLVLSEADFSDMFAHYLPKT